MSEKRRKLETPILRGVSIGALARVSDFYERNPEACRNSPMAGLLTNIVSVVSMVGCGKSGIRAQFG